MDQNWIKLKNIVNPFKCNAIEKGLKDLKNTISKKQDQNISKLNKAQKQSRDWFLKFANGLKIKIDIVHKVHEWPRCLFCQMSP